MNKRRVDVASGAKKQLGRARAVLPPVAKRFRKPSLQAQTETALQNVPRITNETVSEHRETILKGGRKYKYPLEHSKRRIVIISTTLLGLGAIAFVTYTLLSLYKWQTTSSFMHRITQVAPLPIAKTDDRWVSYEDYLFELRRYMHYYETQQKVDFASASGKLQLDMYKPKAMEQVVNAAYVKELAEEKGVRVSDRDVDDALLLLKSQNQLGSSDEELSSVAERFFGWSLSDLRRQLRQEILAQKLAASLDTDAADEAKNVLDQIRSGADFAALAAQASDDASTEANGGQYNDQAITMSSQEVPPKVVAVLGTLKVGETSEVITTNQAFEIVKLLSNEDGKYKAAHIQIRFKDIKTYVDPLKKADPPRYFVQVDAS